MKIIHIPFKLIIVLFFCCIISKVYAQSDSTTLKSISPIQVSFVPFFSFNPMPNAEGVYLSINIIGGYVRSVHAVEAGGVFNIVKNDLRAVQAAGVANFAGGHAEGLQAAGVANFAGNTEGVQAAGVINLAGNANGCQVAGVCNLNRKDITGCQIAGVANLNGGKVKGIQASGVANVLLNLETDSSNNALVVQQIAGVTNVAGCDVVGTQIAGVNNLSKSVTGAQVAGISNACFIVTGSQIGGVINLALGKCEGAQVAGTVNIAKDVRGSQISGCLNIAKSVAGAQIGCFNIADSVNGIAIGVISLIRNGYHKLEVSADEKFYTNLAFRTGMKQFHNILIVSIDPSTVNAPLWAFGYGIGSTFGNRKNMSFDIDLTAQHIHKKQHINWDNNMVKLYFGIDRKLAKNVSIAAGISANALIADTKSSIYKNYFTDFAPYSLSSTHFNNGYNMKTWLGAKVAIRFF